MVVVHIDHLENRGPGPVPFFVNQKMISKITVPHPARMFSDLFNLGFTEVDQGIFGMVPCDILVSVLASELLTNTVDRNL